MNKLILVLAFLAFWARPLMAEELPAPPKSSVEQVSGETQTMGMTLSIRRFETSLSPDAVLAFYQKHWRGEAVESQLPPWRMLAMVKNKRLYNVQLQPQGRGTWGYLSISDLPKQLAEKEPVLPALKNFAAMQGTSLVNEQRHDDGFKTSRVLWLSNQFSVNANGQFYLNHFQNQGWQVLSDSVASRLKPRVLVLQKGRKNISMTISRDQGATQIVAVEETAGLLGL